MNVILYSIGCAKCQILEKKLDQAGIKYLGVNDVDLMLAKGFDEMPVLEVDGKCMGFREAVEWIKEQ